MATIFRYTGPRPQPVRRCLDSQRNYSRYLLLRGMAGVDAMITPHDIADQIAEQLLDDLFAKVILKIGIDEIERYVAGRYISIPAPRPSLREIVDWTVRRLVEKAAKQ